MCMCFAVVRDIVQQVNTCLFDQIKNVLLSKYYWMKLPDQSFTAQKDLVLR